MFDEPDDPSEQRPFNPTERANAKSEEFRMHAELAAVFEGNRKFDAAIVPSFDSELARDIQNIVTAIMQIIAGSAHGAQRRVPGNDAGQRHRFFWFECRCLRFGHRRLPLIQSFTL